MIKVGGRSIGVFEIFLLVLILLNIADFFEFIGDDFDYIKKIISWAVLGILLYKASPTKIFFGEKKDDVDILLIVAWFLLIIKDLVQYVANALNSIQSVHLIPFFTFIIKTLGNNDPLIITIAIIGLVFLSLYCAWKISFHKRSVMGILHEDGEPAPKKFFSRFIMTFLVFVAFFLYVFNMIMEWLAIAVDSVILVLALIVYIVLFLMHKVSGRSFLYEVGDIGSNFYANFLEHFRYKQSFLLGIAGLLVLHALTDIGIFLIPLIINIADSLYLKRFGSDTHQSVWHIVSQDLAQSTADPALILLFIANIFGYLLLFLSPGIIWYVMYKNKKVHLTKTFLTLFYIALPAVVLTPLFLITRLTTIAYVGVDVQTISMLTRTISPYLVVALMAFTGIVAVILARHSATRALLQKGWVAVTIIFFGLYTWYYFLDIASYYQQVVMAFVQHGSYFLAGVFFLFQALTIIFYIGGFGLFLWEIGKHHRSTHSFDVTSNEFKPIT